MAKRRSAGDSKKAIAYLRTSKEEQQLGPEAQRAAIEAWAAREGVQIVAWHTDHVSGGASLEKRTALLAALADLKIHGAGLFVVAKRDRLARDVMVAAMIERLAASNGARIVSTAGEGTDGDDPSAVLMRRMIDAFAEYERALIRARTRAALQVKRGRGERVGRVPFGTECTDGTHLQANELEGVILEQIRSLVASRLSYRRIAAVLQAQGVVSPRTGKPFSHVSIHKLVTRAQPVTVAA